MVWRGSFFAALLFLFLCLPGCDGCLVPSGDNTAPETAEPTVEPVRYAKGFSLKNYRGFALLRIIPVQDGQKDTLRYLLVPKNTPLPKGFKGHTVIRTPISRIAVGSTTQVGFIDLLGETRSIVGVSHPEFVNTPELKERIKTGLVSSIGVRLSLNVESLLELSPDIVAVSAVPASRESAFERLRQAGVPAIVTAEWLEPSPLGRAEWLRVFGALFARDRLADRKFTRIEQAYLRLASLTQKVEKRPLVLSGFPFKDTWFVPAGDSYVAQLLHDAGAFYPWRDRPGVGSLNLGIEAVYPVALEADYWLNPGVVTSMRELLAKDARFRDFSSVRSGRVYNNNRQVNAAGGNAYWEYGVARPDLILRDLIMILHPEVFVKNDSVNSLTFYKKIR